MKLWRGENVARRKKEEQNESLSIGDICHISLLHAQRLLKTLPVFGEGPAS